MGRTEIWVGAPKQNAKILKIRKETVTVRVRIVPSLEGKDDLRLNLSL